MKVGAELIADERSEQIVKHGYTLIGDIESNTNNQLKQAAVNLLFYEDIEDRMHFKPSFWNQIAWDKMCRKDYKHRLIVAGALIAAEIDRLQNIS